VTADLQTKTTAMPIPHSPTRSPPAASRSATALAAASAAIRASTSQLRDRAGHAGLSDNYDLTYHGASPGITPATLTVAADAQTKVYGQGDPALTYQADGFRFTTTSPAS